MLFKTCVPLVIVVLSLICFASGQNATGIEPGTGAGNATAAPEPGGANATTVAELGSANATTAPPEVAPTSPGLGEANIGTTGSVINENATGPGLVTGGNVTEPGPAGENATSAAQNATAVEPGPGQENATANTTPAGQENVIGNATTGEHENATAITTPAGPGHENATTPGPESAAVVGPEKVAESELPSAEKVKFFIVGFRHGNRNPAQFLKNDTSHDKWAWEGASQLTSIGRRQAQALGTFLRGRYGKLVPAEFYPSKIKAYSSSAERCQQTLQSVMLGFYPPVWNRSLLWQPVPYEISDPLLRMYNVKCPEYTSAYQPISEDSGKGADAWLKKEDPELLKYIAENSGLNASLSDLADVADNIGNMRLFNVPLPDWVTKPTLKGYSAKDVFAGIMSFAEAHQILCANDTGCARMMAGLWLDQIIQTLEQAKSGALKGRVANFYAAHTETVLSLVRLLKAEHVPETPTSAGFILEFTDSPAPSVRFIFHEPDPNDADRRLAELKALPYCAGEEWCSLDKFVEAVKSPAFNDWQVACKLPKCPVPNLS